MYYTQEEQYEIADVFERFACDMINSQATTVAALTKDRDNQFSGCDVCVNDSLKVDIKTRIGEWHGNISCDILERYGNKYSFGWLLDLRKKTDWYIFYGFKSTYSGLFIYEYTINAKELSKWYISVMKNNKFTSMKLLNDETEVDRLEKLFLNRYYSEAPLKIDDDKQRKNHRTWFLCIKPENIPVKIKKRTYVIQNIHSEKYEDLLNVKFADAQYIKEDN